MHKASRSIAKEVNRGVRAKTARFQPIGDEPFGPGLTVRSFRLGNGLTVHLVADGAAPVLSYHTWFGVGSRHEEEGKTGLAHLFEHLMFKATSTFEAGTFDRLLESAGGETNAATWTDWTYYYENIPSHELELVVRLEADRMQNLVLDDAQVAAEKDVVMNERRYTVDDDVEGTTHELLWSKAFRAHPYRWPTIGWMKDIEGFTVDDCLSFYETYYAPNNATVVMVGDLDPVRALRVVQDGYGAMKPSRIPKPRRVVEPEQNRQRRARIRQPTDTVKLELGYRAPGFSHYDHAVLVIADEILSGGRSSRLYSHMVDDLEVASEVSASIAPFRETTLFSIWASARDGTDGKTLLREIDREVGRLADELVTDLELEKAKNRLELGFLSVMETVGGKAEQLGFAATVLGDVGSVFHRLEEYRRVTAADVRRVAREYLDRRRRTVIEVLPQGGR